MAIQWLIARPVMFTQKMRRSRLFVVRTWLEQRGENSVKWRAMVRDVQSGETRYFGDSQDVAAFVRKLLDEQERSESHRQWDS